MGGSGYWKSTASSALGGGIASAMSGGNFGEGAMRGAYANSFNQFSDKLLAFGALSSEIEREKMGNDYKDPHDMSPEDKLKYWDEKTSPENVLENTLKSLDYIPGGYSPKGILKKEGLKWLKNLRLG